MTAAPERAAPRSRTPAAAGRRASMDPVSVTCDYLHNAFGPGCPYCVTAAGSAVAQAAPFRLPGGAGVPLPPVTRAVLLSPDSRVSRVKADSPRENPPGGAS